MRHIPFSVAEGQACWLGAAEQRAKPKKYWLDAEGGRAVKTAGQAPRMGTRFPTDGWTPKGGARIKLLAGRRKEKQRKCWQDVEGQACARTLRATTSKDKCHGPRCIPLGPASLKPTRESVASSSVSGKSSQRKPARWKQAFGERKKDRIAEKPPPTEKPPP